MFKICIFLSVIGAFLYIGATIAENYIRSKNKKED